LCQELTAQHQTKTYNVDKLSELLIHQAKLWERIGQSPRTKPEYFRVAYFGDGFTPLNLNKEFVVRGEPWQRYSDL
jgi:dedicator of cytokinesis protein 3